LGPFCSLFSCNKHSFFSACGQGRYQPNEGTTECLNCIPGRYQTNEKQSECIDCEVGRASDAVAHDSECGDCTPGTKQPKKGRTSCLDCIPGRHQPNAGTEECIKCKKDTYAGKAKQISCSDCAVGRLTSGTNSVSCISCGAGTYGVGCQKCPIGWYRGAGDPDLTKCLQCDKGETTVIGAASCSGCDVGMYGAAPGTCSDCPAGRYQDAKRQEVCKDCPVNTWSKEIKKSSVADCQDCHKQERTTGALTGAHNSSFCLCKRGVVDEKFDGFYQTSKNTNNTCVPCPSGADCTADDGISLLLLVAKTGYWRPDPNSDVFSACLQGYKGMDGEKLAEQRCCPPGQCPKNGSLTNGTMFTNPDEQCKLGYGGALCLVCTENYVMVAGECIECAGKST
jgi:hypothetical protein